MNQQLRDELDKLIKLEKIHGTQLSSSSDIVNDAEELDTESNNLYDTDFDLVTYNDEVIVSLMCQSLNLNEEKYILSGKDEFDGILLSPRDIDNSTNSISYVLNQRTLNIYDEISLKCIKNLVNDKEPLTSDVIIKSLKDGYDLTQNAEKVINGGYLAGNNVVLYGIVQDNKFVSQGELYINPINGKVYNEMNVLVYRIEQ